MKDRGKALENFNGDSCLPCRKHPSSTSSSSGGGICGFCLRDRLMELICPECGEQRLSSCSCSENSSDPSSNPRISFLLEKENSDLSKIPKIAKTGEPVDASNNRGGFWRIGRLFRKSRNNIQKDDSKSEMWVSDIVGVPRSRSLCSFRGADTEESGGMSYSAARVSSVSGGFMMDSAKRSCFSESEARISNFDGRISNFDYERDMIGKGFFTMREGCEFSCSDDPKFIDLKLDLSSSSSEVRTEYPVLKRGKEFGFGSMRGANEYYGMFKNGGGSCRFSVSERDLKKCRKSRKVWRWFFRASSKFG